MVEGINYGRCSRMRKDKGHSLSLRCLPTFIAAINPCVFHIRCSIQSISYTMSAAAMNTVVSRERYQEIRGTFDRFRILIIGRRNSGKTTVLQRVCDTTEKPEIINKKGKQVGIDHVRASHSSHCLVLDDTG